MIAKRPKILMIDDNPDFGGHQVMAAYGLEGMLRFGEWDVVALHHPDNSKNIDRWRSIGESTAPDRLTLEIAPTRSTKFQAVRRIFESEKIDLLRARIQDIDPDLILVIQGNIEQCCSVFRLVRQVDCPVVSYIPVPHKHAEMGAKLGTIRDLTCSGLYGEPDGYITISNTLGEMLRRYGATGRIEIVENGIPLDRFTSLPAKEVARANLGLPEGDFIWGQVGRTEFMQKGQDFALELFLERSKENSNESIAFLGSGPDSDLLQQQAKGQGNVYCLPWVDDPTEFYAAIDGLILPSRYEGVPLAMLEALANGIPVAATNRDGICDWLPGLWRFPYRDKMEGLRALDEVRKADAEVVGELKDRVWSCHTVEAFQRAYNDALITWL